MGNRLAEVVQSMRRGSVPTETTEDSLAGIDVSDIFAQAEFQYGPTDAVIPVGRTHDIPMTDENVAHIIKQYGLSIAVIGHKLGEGGQIDMELVGAQVALKAVPNVCRELSKECFGSEKTFEELSGERRAELARFSLGRRGTDEQEREYTRRRRLNESLGGRLRVSTEDVLGQLAGTIAQRLTRSGREI